MQAVKHWPPVPLDEKGFLILSPEQKQKYVKECISEFEGFTKVKFYTVKAPEKKGLFSIFNRSRKVPSLSKEKIQAESQKAFAEWEKATGQKFPLRKPIGICSRLVKLVGVAAVIAAVAFSSFCYMKCA